MSVRRGGDLIWSARFASQLGNELSVLAVPFLLLAESDSDGAFGFVYAAEYLPFLLLGLHAGSVVARLGIVRTMVLADLARFGVFGLLVTVPLSSGAVTVWAVLVAAALAGSASACDGAAYRSLQPMLSDALGERAVRTYARFEVAQTLAMLLGPLLAGVLVEVMHPRGAIAVDALTFLLSGILVLRGARLLRQRLPLSVEIGRVAPQARERVPLRRCVAEVRRSRVASVIILGTAAMTTAASAGYVVLIVFANRVLGLEAVALGLVFTVAGCGALLGAVVSRWVGDAQVGRVFVGASIVGAVASAAMPLAAPGVAGFLVLAGAQFVANVAGSISRVTSIDLRQRSVSSWAHAYLEAGIGAAQYGMRAVGAVAGGVLAIAAGPRTALTIAVVANLVAVIAMVGALRGHGRHPAESEGVETMSP